MNCQSLVNGGTSSFPNAIVSVAKDVNKKGALSAASTINYG